MELARTEAWIPGWGLTLSLEAVWWSSLLMGAGFDHHLGLMTPDVGSYGSKLSGSYDLSG